MADFCVKFVSQKINKIRWRPKNDLRSSNSTIFATGSWDDEQNTVCLWQLEDKIPSASSDGNESSLEHEPQKIFEAPHKGDVTDMQYVSGDVLVVASSNGDVNLMKHNHNIQDLVTVSSWERLHYFENGSNAPCTCLSSRGDDWVVTGGEDGRLAVVAIGQAQPLQTIDKADSCTIHALTFLKQTEVLTVNSFGQLKTFDLRQDGKKHARLFSVTEGHTPLLCVDKHPGQAHIVATGGEDGMLTIWDLRQDKFPMTLLEAHTGAMWEVKFHPHNPNHLFTCSDDGSLWHWDGSAFSDSLTSFPGIKGKAPLVSDGITSPWLTLETSKHKLDIASLLPNKSLPVNSLDIESSTLICGTDSETIYSIQLPML